MHDWVRNRHRQPKFHRFLCVTNSPSRFLILKQPRPKFRRRPCMTNRHRRLQAVLTAVGPYTSTPGSFAVSNSPLTRSRRRTRMVQSHPRPFGRVVWTIRLAQVWSHSCPPCGRPPDQVQRVHQCPHPMTTSFGPDAHVLLASLATKTLKILYKHFISILIIDLLYLNMGSK